MKVRFPSNFSSASKGRGFLEILADLADAVFPPAMPFTEAQFSAIIAEIARRGPIGGQELDAAGLPWQDSGVLPAALRARLLEGGTISSSDVPAIRSFINGSVYGGIFVPPPLPFRMPGGYQPPSPPSYPGPVSPTPLPPGGVFINPRSPF